MIQINSVADFEKRLSRFRDYRPFYRGQSSKYPIINASISRVHGWSANEHIIYSDALSKSADKFSALETPLARLAKMQHYEIPTRLIDFTMNPYVALYFAVEDIDCESAGNVYLYIQPAESVDSQHVRLLTLLATLEDYDLAQIESQYFKRFSEPISSSDILEFAQNPAFIQATEVLHKSNPRLSSQAGTFVVCANQVRDCKIVKGAIEPLEHALPTGVFQVPYEYKKIIKAELDSKYDIRSWSIYPQELPSLGKYLREKHRLEKIPEEGSYIIVDKENISYGLARRLSLKVVLQRALRIDQIREEAVSIMRQYQPLYDVIWLYVAKSPDDLILSNWVIQGQWISQDLDPVFRPTQIGIFDNHGYSWVYPNSYETLSSYYAENVFEEDKTLYASYFKTYDEFFPVFIMLNETFRSGLDTFSDALRGQEDKINRVCDLFGFFGVSRNEDFNQFLENFESFILSLSNTLYGRHKDDDDLTWKRQVASCLQDAEAAVRVIETQRMYWRKKLRVSERDYNEITPTRKEQPRFRQSIPISPTALEVDFDVQFKVLPNRTIQVVGETNLYDKASLMLTVLCEGRVIGQSKAQVGGGMFDFGELTMKGLGYVLGSYVAEISISLPHTQPKEFVDKAGIEYENLTGPYVERSGIGGPTIRYRTSFAVK